jgi:hypothetical protein
MKNLLFAICFVALPFWLVATLTEAQSVQPGSADSTAASEAKGRNAKYQSLAQELNSLHEGLAVKQAELAKLRHKWTVNKGRTPTAEEIKTFEEKRAKGAVKVEDNPYINRNPLSSPGRWRAAYYKKLDEINKDKERANRLEQELDELNQ